LFEADCKKISDKRKAMEILNRHLDNAIRTFLALAQKSWAACRQRVLRASMPYFISFFAKRCTGSGGCIPGCPEREL